MILCVDPDDTALTETLSTLEDAGFESAGCRSQADARDLLDGFGVLLVDPATHDERTVGTLGQFCAGYVEVRDADDGPESRARGLPGQPRDWTPFEKPD